MITLLSSIWLQSPAPRPAATAGWSSGVTISYWPGALTRVGSISPANNSRSQTGLVVMLIPAIHPSFPYQTTAYWYLIQVSTGSVANTVGWIVAVSRSTHWTWSQ